MLALRGDGLTYATERHQERQARLGARESFRARSEFPLPPLAHRASPRDLRPAGPPYTTTLQTDTAWARFFTTSGARALTVGFCLSIW